MFAGSILLLAAVAQAAHIVDYDNLNLRTVYARQESAVVQAEQVSVKNFTYHGGETGPMNWANLPGWADNKICATGKRQSPINLDGSIGAGSAPTFSYTDGRDFILENIGTTLEAITDSANLAALTVARADGKKFTFNNFHFHIPSEHHLNDEVFPLEMHIVNTSPTDGNLVLTVLFQFATVDDQFIGSVARVADRVRTPGSSTSISRLSFRPLRNVWADNNARKVYGGSLTTPPCTENTQFVIGTTPLDISPRTYNLLKSIMKFNSRYTQNGLGKVNLLQLPQPQD